MGFHLGFLSRGEGGGKCNNCPAKGGGGKDYSNNSNAFSLARNIIELIDFLKLGGLGARSPRKFFQSLRLFLVASETKFSWLGSLLPVHCYFYEHIC